jgi:uncharacterized membrane protein
MSVLNVQDFVYDEKKPDEAMADIFIVGVRLSIILSFVMILITLIMINIFRIVAIWFAISFAPLLIIAMVL